MVEWPIGVFGLIDGRPDVHEYEVKMVPELNDFGARADVRRVDGDVGGFGGEVVELRLCAKPAVFFPLIPVVIPEGEESARFADRGNLRIEDPRGALVVFVAWRWHSGRVDIVSDHHDSRSIRAERLDACGNITRKRDEDRLDQFRGIGSGRIGEFGVPRISDQKGRFDDGPGHTAYQRRVEGEFRFGLARSNRQRAKHCCNESPGAVGRACAAGHGSGC